MAPPCTWPTAAPARSSRSTSTRPAATWTGAEPSHTSARPAPPRTEPWAEDEGDSERLEELLPSPDAGPEAAYARTVLIEELELALGELPAEQRAVFVAHEIEGRSFRELAAESGISVNTLLSRKRYAVLHLRRRLESIHADFGKE